MLAPLNFQGQIPVIRGPPFCGASFLSLVQLMGEKQPAIWGRGGGVCRPSHGPVFFGIFWLQGTKRNQLK